MNSSKIIALVVLFACFTESQQSAEVRDLIETRGHGGGGEYAILIHFLWVAATKLFVLKLVYGALFYAIATKAWHFVVWFLHYLKEKKHHHHEHVEYIEDDHAPIYDHHDHDDHGYHDHGHYDHQPYRYKPSYDDIITSASYKKPVYDADGSYSVRSR